MTRVPTMAMTACTQCGKRTTPDSIHTCSPQVLRDETLPEPDMWLPYGTYALEIKDARAMGFYTEANLREAIKGARKKALEEARVACFDLPCNVDPLADNNDFEVETDTITRCADAVRALQKDKQ